MRADANLKRTKLTAEAIQAGALRSDRFLLIIFQALDRIDQDAISRAMCTLRDFAARMDERPTQIAVWARPHLENLGNTVLGQAPPGGDFRDRKERATNQYRAIFQQRLDGALRDFEIGFAEGADIAGPGHGPRQQSGEVLSLKPGLH
jgi:hypothetical protein